jgi:hypothetical protein
MTGAVAFLALCAGAMRASGNRAAGAIAGAGLFAALSWIGLLATGVLGPWWMDALSIAVGAAMLLVPPPAEPPESRPSPVPRAMLLAAALLAAGLFAAALWSRPDGGWDAMLIWNLRARLLTASPPLPTAFDRRLFHTDYPPLVSLLGARSGSPALVALGFAVATPLALYRFARRAAGADPAALATAMLLATPVFASVSAAQYADVPLAAFVLAAAGFALEGRLVWAGLCAGLSLLVKNDAAMEVACLGLVVLAARPWRTWRFGLGVLPGLASLASFKLSPWPQKSELVAAWTTSAVLPRLADASRYGAIALAFAKVAVRPLDWGAGLLAAVALLAVRRRRSGPGLLAGFLAACLAALFLVYLTTPYPLGWHLETSLDRLLLQLWPSALLLCAIALAGDVDAAGRIG